MSEKVEKYYQNQGKELVDNLFNKRVFNDSMSREDLQKVEDLLAFYLQSTADSSAKMTKLTMDLKRG